MYRDFSEKAKQTLLGMVADVENEKICDFTDWVGDRWLDFQGWIGTLNIKRYIDNVNEYHKKVIDKNNATKKTIEEIFGKVSSVDCAYEGIFGNLSSSLSRWQTYIEQLRDITNPSKGNFNAKSMQKKLNKILQDVAADDIDCLRDRMVQDVDGELTFNEELIYEYVKKSPAEMSDAEQKLLLEVIAKLKNTVAVYETLATVGDDELGADYENRALWVSKDKKYESYTAVSKHYNEIYVNLLNYIVEQSEDEKTFASSLVKIGFEGGGVLIYGGTEIYENLKDIFGNDSLETYVMKYKDEHSEEYYKKMELSEAESFSSGGKLENISEGFNSRKEKTEQYLKDKGLYREKKDVSYFDIHGNEIKEKDAPDFYKRQLTLGEINGTKQVKYSLYDGTFDTPLGGTAHVTVGEAEMHASASGGFYIVGKDGQQVFSPGVSAKVGMSATGFRADYENQLLGNEMIGVNVDASVTAFSASVEGGVDINFLGKDEKGNIVFDPQVNVGVSAEAVLFEAEGSVGVNVLGGEVGVSGSVKVGVGAHADVGYKDGVFKCEIGASLGIGFDVGIEVDVGGMVNTVADAASSAWDGIKNGWKSFWG